MIQTGKQKRNGLFISLEGGEGTGKSTQINILAGKLELAGYKVITTREPGGTELAEEIRNFVLSSTAEAFGPEFEAMLFTAARLDHIEKVIAPALQEGKVVLTDRFADSTRVYQGGSGKIPAELLTGLEELVRDLVWPELTFVLDLDAEEGMRRADDRRSENSHADRFEKEHIQEHIERRKAFKAIVKAEPQRCRLIDASREEDAVAREIWQVLQPEMEKKFGMSNE